jgi:hypothetical protein
MKKISFALLSFCLSSVMAMAQHQVVQRTQPVVEAADPTANMEKRIMLMTSMMKESGFDAQMIEGYQEMAKKNFNQMMSIERNEKLKPADRDVLVKKIISNEDAELKKLFGDDFFEKYQEMLKKLTEN